MKNSWEGIHCQVQYLSLARGLEEIIIIRTANDKKFFEGNTVGGDVIKSDSRWGGQLMLSEWSGPASLRRWYLG